MNGPLGQQAATIVPPPLYWVPCGQRVPQQDRIILPLEVRQHKVTRSWWDTSSLSASAGIVHRSQQMDEENLQPPPSTLSLLSLFMCVQHLCVTVCVSPTCCYFVCRPARRPAPRTAARSSEEHTLPSASTTDWETERWCLLWLPRSDRIRQLFNNLIPVWAAWCQYKHQTH